MPGSGLARRHAATLGFSHQLLDVVTIWLVLLATTVVIGIGWNEKFTVAALLASLLFILLGRQNDLYRSWRTESLNTEVRRLLATWVTVILICLLLGYALKISEDFSRRAIVAWMLAVPVVLSLYRAILRSMLRQLRSTGKNFRRIAIVGAGSTGRELAAIFASHPWMGIQLCGFYDDEGIPVADEELVYLGSLQQLILDARRGDFDEIYIALRMTAVEEIRSTINGLADCSVQVNLVPDLFTFKLVNSKIRDIAGLPVISVYDSPLDAQGHFVKRLEDVLVSSIILILIALPMMVIAAAVKLTSPGPVIFHQRRYGLSGEEIWVWKFRTMDVMEDGDSIVQVKEGDTRVTRLGSFLRRTSLDELPQFINVLQGSMSVVGPRPHAVAHNEEYRASIDGYMLRHLVKPGITGWAQINGWRGETDTLDKMEQRVEHDLYYIRNWSLRLDLFIIVMTIFKGFVSKKAY